MDKQSNKTNTNPTCCCLLALGTRARVREISLWIGGGHCLWPPCSRRVVTVRLHWQDSHCRAQGTASRAQSLWSEMLTHSKSQALIYSTPCVAICLHSSSSVSPSARQSVSVILNRSSVCDHSDEDGWRNTDAGRQVTLRVDSAIPGMLHATYGCVPLMTLRTKWAHRLEREPQAKWAGFHGGHFSIWFQPGETRADGCITGKVICQGSLRSGDIHHIVCEKYCLLPSFFFCLFSWHFVWIGVQFVLHPSFIRKLKMLHVYPGPDLFSFSWPRMGKEHV